jgi:hypothetical protein
MVYNESPVANIAVAYVDLVRNLNKFNRFETNFCACAYGRTVIQLGYVGLGSLCGE